MVNHVKTGLLVDSQTFVLYKMMDLIFRSNSIKCVLGSNRPMTVPAPAPPPARMVNLCSATQTIIAPNPMLQGALLMQQMQGNPSTPLRSLYTWHVENLDPSKLEQYSRCLSKRKNWIPVQLTELTPCFNVHWKTEMKRKYERCIFNMLFKLNFLILASV